MLYRSLGPIFRELMEADKHSKKGKKSASEEKRGKKAWVIETMEQQSQRHQQEQYQQKAMRADEGEKYMGPAQPLGPVEGDVMAGEHPEEGTCDASGCSGVRYLPPRHTGVRKPAQVASPRAVDTLLELVADLCEKNKQLHKQLEELGEYAKKLEHLLGAQSCKAPSPSLKTTVCSTLHSIPATGVFVVYGEEDIDGRNFTFCNE